MVRQPGLDRSDGFQVKRILAKTGASLSLQKHYLRAEHWIVVRYQDAYGRR